MSRIRNRPVQNRHSHSVLQIPQLSSRKFIIENDGICFHIAAHFRQLFHLAFSDVSRLIRALPHLYDFTQDFRSGGFGEGPSAHTWKN